MTAIYVRQSVNKKDSISIESQIEKCLIETQGEYKIYQDKGFSAKTINRPGFLKMMEDVEQKKIDKIVVYRLDRFSRSITDFSKIWDILSQYHVDFISVNEKFDTASPMGRAMLHIIMIFAQLERETIAERVKDNYYMRAKNGAWAGGPAPFGFSIEKKMMSNKKVSCLVPNQYIFLIEKIFQIYAQKDASLGSVAKEINKISNQRKWDTVSISRILHNPVYVKCDNAIYEYYCGKHYIMSQPKEAFTGVQGGMIIGKYTENEKCFLLSSHKGILSSKLFLQCQYKLEKNNQIKNTGKGKYTFLSGFLKCGICGYSLKVVCSKGKRYFVCSGRTNYYIQHKTDYICLDAIEKAFEEETEKLFSSIENDFIKNNTEIIKIEKKIHHLIEALAEGNAVSKKYIYDEIEALEQKKNLIQKQYTNETTTKYHFSDMNDNQKKKMTKQLLEKIFVFSDKAEFYWKI